MAPTVVDPAAAALARARSAARGAGRLALRAAVVAAVSATVLTWALFSDGVPDETAETVARAVVAAALFSPAAVLVLFWRACVEALEVPQRVRSLPGTAAGRAVDLGRVLRDRQAHPARRAWRVLRLTSAARELLGVHAPLLVLVSPPFLLATAAALAAAALEALVALGVLAALV
jgi:hypothetical protein